MSRLEEIQLEVAKEKGFENLFAMYYNSNYRQTKEYIKEINHRYAIEVTKATLQKASENAVINMVTLGQNDLIQQTKSVYHAESKTEFTINKNSITNPENIILL